MSNPEAVRQPLRVAENLSRHLVRLLPFALGIPLPWGAMALGAQAPLRVQGPQETPGRGGRGGGVDRREPTLAVIHEVWLGDGDDAERVDLPQRPLGSGPKFELRGRLSTLSLEFTRWDARTWQVRYRFGKGVADFPGAGNGQTGAFLVEAGSRKEFQTAVPGVEGRGRVHLIRIDLQGGARPGSSSGRPLQRPWMDSLRL